MTTACSDFEVAIMEYPQLPEAQRAEVDRHLAVCADCRALAGELQKLDAMLTCQIKAPTLRADFNKRLAHRIQTERVAMSEAERAERKRQFETEFKAGMGHLRRTVWAVLFLDGIGLAVMGALGGWFFWGFSKHFAAVGDNQSMTLLAVTGVVCLGLGVLAVLSQPVRRCFSAS